MNRFKKYCPNVWIAECEEAYTKGDIIELETKYGKMVECEVFNLISQTDDKWYYSILRVEEMNYAQRKAQRYNEWALSRSRKSDEYYEASQEGKEFLALAEPVKIGHHSEKSHRALFERNRNRMDKSMENLKKANEHLEKAEYWENRTDAITLAIPESLEHFKAQLVKAEELQKGLKSGEIIKGHEYSLTYATKAVKELKKKVEIARILWG